MKIDPYYQRLKCKAETVLCENIRIMPIFMGVRWIVGIKWEWGLLLVLVVAISFQTSHMTPKLLCLSMQSPNGFSSTSKQMTLN